MNVLYAQTMATYNNWMNTRLYEACARLPEATRKSDLGAFFKSMHGTLNHLLLADRVWLGRFTGGTCAVKSLDQELCADFSDLTQERARTDLAITQWAASLREEDFAKALTYTTITKPQPRTTPFWLAVVHFFNHQTHHRGQLTTLLMQSGVDPGVTDLLWLPQTPAASGSR